VLAALADADSAEAPLVAAPLVVGGRSAGARVACRTALATGARGVLCLAFPLHPPGRPERSRAAELAGAGVDVHVVQGRRDAFGGPAEIEALDLPRVHVAPVDGDHGLKAAGGGGVREAVAVALGMLGPDAVF
jgi:predicted alpha/beta-hydrolase family hydrolase